MIRIRVDAKSALCQHARFNYIHVKMVDSKSNAPIYCLWAWEKPEGYKRFLQLWLPYSCIQHTVKASTLWCTAAVEDKWKSPRTMIWLYASLLLLKIDGSYAETRKKLVASVYFAEKWFLNFVVHTLGNTPENLTWALAILLFCLMYVASLCQYIKTFFYR